MYDVFVAPLRCPGCDRLVDAEIQTHIRNVSADGSSLPVGYELDPYDLTTESIVDSGYALVHPPDADGPIRLLNVWICYSCQTEQWAMVEIVDRKIRSIDAVKLDHETLESANFISTVDAELLADALRDQDDTTGETTVDLLRQRLPAR